MPARRASGRGGRRFKSGKEKCVPHRLRQTGENAYNTKQKNKRENTDEKSSNKLTDLAVINITKYEFHQANE